VDTRDECYWPHACLLQASRRGNQGHPRVHNSVRKRAPYTLIRSEDRTSSQIKAHLRYCDVIEYMSSKRQWTPKRKTHRHRSRRTFSVAKIMAIAGKSGAPDRHANRIPCMLVSRPQAWKPMASSSAHVSSKMSTLPSLIAQLTHLQCLDGSCGGTSKKMNAWKACE
jgi:hypothetical protein